MMPATLGFSDADLAERHSLLQDSWVVHECLGGSSNIALAVFDGHGQEGERVSRYVAATLPGMLAKSSAFKVRRRSTSRPAPWLHSSGLRYVRP